MKIINRIILLTIVMLSVIIGILPSIRSTTMNYIIYVCIMLLMLIYIFTKFYKGNFKINVYIVILAIFLILRDLL